MFQANPYENVVPEEAELLRQNYHQPIPPEMPNPVSWNFRNFDWTFGAPPSSTTAPSNNLYQNDIRKFTAGNEPEEAFMSIPAVPCKRKSLDSSPAATGRPAKQFISERKMIEYLSGLHLSTEFTNHNISPIDLEEMSEPQTRNVFMSPADLEERLKNAQKITICDEVRKITDDPLLPKALLERASVPTPYCSALVLWQPPTNVLKVNFDDKEKEEPDEEVKKKNEPSPSTSGIVRESEVNSMEADLLFDNNNSSSVDFNNLDTMDLDM